MNTPTFTEIEEVCAQSQQLCAESRRYLEKLQRERKQWQRALERLPYEIAERAGLSRTREGESEGRT